MKKSNQDVAMEWWKNNSATYPNGSCVFRQICSIPASQIESERNFSIAGILTAARRSRLGVSTLDDISFIHHNLTPDALSKFYKHPLLGSSLDTLSDEEVM
jgi:hAT family C-terminal dimerisation region